MNVMIFFSMHLLPSAQCHVPVILHVSPCLLVYMARDHVMSPPT